MKAGKSRREFGYDMKHHEALFEVQKSQSVHHDFRQQSVTHSERAFCESRHCSKRRPIWLHLLKPFQRRGSRPQGEKIAHHPFHRQVRGEVACALAFLETKSQDRIEREVPNAHLQEGVKSHWQGNKHGRTFQVSIAFLAFPRLLFLSLPYFPPEELAVKPLKQKRSV